MMDALFDGSDAHLLPGPQTSYLTDDDVHAAQVLHKRTPYRFHNITASQLSIARHPPYRIVYNGETYIYFAEFDELVRDDVLAFVHKRRRAADALERAAEDARQLGLEY